MAEFRDIVIGIDLGTTNSCAALYINNQVKILENNQGERLTPSVVAYTTNNATVVGDMAKKISLRTPESSVCQIKRLIGRNTSDLNVQSSLKYFPYILDENSDKPTILIKQKNETIRKTPVEISTIILKKIKHDVEEKLAVKIQKAVITVPAYFNFTQREATLAAAKAAGFTVPKLMNEPTAAALSYYHESKTENENYSLVFDLGGGTLDVAILKKQKNDIQTIGVDGDSYLGGQDIDNLIIDFVCNKLEKDYDCNCRENPHKMRRLQKICEDAKEHLSYYKYAELPLEGFSDNHDFIKLELTRSQLEELSAILFERSLRIVSNCLVNCNLKKNDIGDVILSGGSTRIPKLRQMLSEFFDNKPLQKLLNFDECVAAGAALQAAMFSTNPIQKIQYICITDVTVLSLGVLTTADVMHFVIRRNTPLPATTSITYFTLENNQKAMTFDLYEGERLNATKNRYLGKLRIDNLTPAPPGKCEVSLTLSIDDNGILKLEATEKLNKNKIKQLTVTYTRGCRNDNEVRNALKDAEDHKDEDTEFMKFATYKRYLIKFCNAIVYNLESAHLVKDNNHIFLFCQSTAYKAKRMEIHQEEDIKRLIKETEKKTQPLIKKYNIEGLPSLEDEAKSLNVTLP